MQIEGSLKVTNTYRNILKIALPISIAILIPQLNFLTNTLFLGRFTSGFGCGGYLLPHDGDGRLWVGIGYIDVDES